METKINSLIMWTNGNIILIVEYLELKAVSVGEIKENDVPVRDIKLELPIREINPIGFTSSEYLHKPCTV